VKPSFLDTVSTTGSLISQRPEKQVASFPGGSSAGPGFLHKREAGTRFTDPKSLKFFSSKWFKKKQNRDQVREIFRGVKETTGSRDFEYSRELIKGGASLRYCNNVFLVKQVPGGLAPVTAWNCGRKYCAICSQKKRKKLLFRYIEFFESTSGQILLDSYDLALFTVTLKHNAENLRTEPYYQELAEHWRNGIKYGAFKKYLAGGFYNTEHTFTKNGHHIHRHALVLIPKEFNLEEDHKKIQEELRSQWKQRTGGSFQIDLTPFRQDRTLKENLLEVTKYITKRGKGGVIPWQVVKAVEENNRAKFLKNRVRLITLNLFLMNFLSNVKSCSLFPDFAVMLIRKKVRSKKEPFMNLIHSKN
jgi:hypothetical protein